MDYSIHLYQFTYPFPHIASGKIRSSLDRVTVYLHLQPPPSLGEGGGVKSRQKEQCVQRPGNHGEHSVIGELKYVVQNGWSKNRREMERQEAER